MAFIHTDYSMVPASMAMPWQLTHQTIQYVLFVQGIKRGIGFSSILQCAGTINKRSGHIGLIYVIGMQEKISG